MGEVIGGILGGIGSVGGAIIQANAAKEAREQALTGYNYLTKGPGSQINNAFLNYGGRGIHDADVARATQMELLGLGGGDTGGAPPGTGGPMAPGPGGGGPMTGGDMPPSLTGGSSPGTIRNYWNGGYHVNPDTSGGGIRPAPGFGGRGDDVRYAPGRAPAGTGGSMQPQMEMVRGPDGTYGLAPVAGGGAPAMPAGAGNAFKRYLDSTGYQFQLGQGQDAITTSAASRGLLRSGGTAKALTKYGQDLASTTFNNYLAQVGNVGNSGANAGVTGQNQLQMITNAGTGAGGNAAGYITEGGNAWAQGLSGGLGNLAQIFANSQRNGTAAAAG